MEKTLNLIKNDPWLEPFADAIAGRHQFVLDKEALGYLEEAAKVSPDNANVKKMIPQVQDAMK